MSPVVCALGAIKFKIMVPWGMWSAERGVRSEERGARSEERGARSEERGARRSKNSNKCRRLTKGRAVWGSVWGTRTRKQHVSTSSLNFEEKVREGGGRALSPGSGQISPRTAPCTPFPHSPLPIAITPHATTCRVWGVGSRNSWGLLSTGDLQSCVLAKLYLRQSFRSGCSKFEGKWEGGGGGPPQEMCPQDNNILLAKKGGWWCSTASNSALRPDRDSRFLAPNQGGVWLSRSGKHEMVGAGARAWPGCNFRKRKLTMATRAACRSLCHHQRVVRPP